MTTIFVFGEAVTSYIVQVVSICLAWILQPLQFSLLSLTS